MKNLLGMSTMDFRERYSNAYQPKVDNFFKGLSELALPYEELSGIPGLFLPCCGTLYDDSLLKIAFIGKETYGWNDSLASNLDQFKEGNYDVFDSINLFRSTGPKVWRNQFWWYVTEALAVTYGLDAHQVLDKESETPLLKCFAWNNCYNIEFWSSKGVDKDNLQWSSMCQIQKLVKNADISSIDTFIDVFRPNVIIQMFRNQADEESFKITQNASYIKDWGPDDFLKEYSYRGVIILQCGHPNYLQKSGIGRDKLARTFREVLCSHGMFKLLGGMRFYNAPEQCTSISILANQLANESSELSNQDIVRNVVGAIALELRKQNAWMSAQCLVFILNSIEQFRKCGWQYSTLGRGPCAVVRGVYNYFAGVGNNELADFVALSFTKLDGEIAWE